jgi:hypothetical protein
VDFVGPFIDIKENLKWLFELYMGSNFILQEEAWKKGQRLPSNIPRMAQALQPSIVDMIKHPLYFHYVSVEKANKATTLKRSTNRILLIFWVQSVFLIF